MSGPIGSAAARRQYRGPALFSHGFRPFFLFAALWSSVSAPLWVIAYLGRGPDIAALGRDWHIHEMSFGYAGGVLAGFLTTSIPNWTGRMPIVGAPLAGVFLLWVAGRAAMLLAPRLGLAAAIVDCAFLIVFAAMVWREILAGRNWRNAPVAGLVTLLAGANIAFHARGAWPELGAVAERVAIAIPVMMICLIGGRIIPSFSRNWLAQHGKTQFPAPPDRLDAFGLALAALALLAWVVIPDATVTGVALVAAGLVAAIRLARWRGADARAEPLVWILHLGFAWLAFGLALLGGSIIAPDMAPRSAGLHALTAGAIGVMTLAVMTRASLGHSGRPLHADAPIAAIYALVNIAALARVAAAAVSVGAQSPLLILAAFSWSAAFALFVLVFAPLLARARPTPRP